nr:unnamed protein product [Callosobruchus analis]
MHIFHVTFISSGSPLPKNRVKLIGGNITIESLRRSDFGFYQCVASNEVATIVTATQLVVEGTQPHAPYNLTASATEFSVTLSWLPGYSGGPDYKQVSLLLNKTYLILEFYTLLASTNLGCTYQRKRR